MSRELNNYLRVYCVRSMKGGKVSLQKVIGWNIMHIPVFCEPFWYTPRNKTEYDRIAECMTESYSKPPMIRGNIPLHRWYTFDPNKNYRY